MPSLIDIVDVVVIVDAITNADICFDNVMLMFN